MRVAKRGCGDAIGAAVDAIAVYESVARSGGDGVFVVGVSVIKIVRVDDVGVANDRIVHIDVMHVAESGVIPRVERLTPTEREPTNAAAETEAEPHADTKAAAEKADEGGTVIGRSPDWSGCPTPTTAPEAPATVVIRSKTPRFVADPTPAPGTDIIPRTVTIGSPTGSHIIGI